MKRGIIFLSLFLVSVLFISGCLSDVESLANEMEEAWDQIDSYSVKIEKTNLFGETYEISEEYLKKPNKRRIISYDSISYDESSILEIKSVDDVYRYEYFSSIKILEYSLLSGAGGYQPNYETLGAFDRLNEMMHNFEGEVEITSYEGQEAYRMYLVHNENGRSFGVYGDIEIWVDTEFYLPLEVKSYLKDEDCEVLSNFFSEEGMEIQNCFTTEKFIDREIDIDLSDEFFDLRNEVSEDTEVILVPSPGSGSGYVCGNPKNSTDFINEASFIPYVPTYLPFEGLFFQIPSQVNSSDQDYLDENFVEGDYITGWGEEPFTHPCPYGKDFIFGTGSKVYEDYRSFFGQAVNYEVVDIAIAYKSKYDENYLSEDGTTRLGDVSFEQSQSSFFHYGINTQQELFDLEIGESYLSEWGDYGNIQVTEYLIVEINGDKGIAVINRGNSMYSVPNSETGELQEYNFEDEIKDIDLYWKNGENYFTISWNNDYVHEWETGEEVLIVEDVDILIDMAESIQPYDTTELEVLGCEIWWSNIYSNLGICDAIPV